MPVIRHREQQERYVIVGGSRRAKRDDVVVGLETRDVIRDAAPGVWSFEAVPGVSTSPASTVASPTEDMERDEDFGSLRPGSDDSDRGDTPQRPASSGDGGPWYSAKPR